MVILVELEILDLELLERVPEDWEEDRVMVGVPVDWEDMLVSLNF